MEIPEPLEDTERRAVRAASAPALSVDMAAADRPEPIRREEAPASAAVDRVAEVLAAVVVDAEAEEAVTAAEAGGIADRSFVMLVADRKGFTWREAICAA
jgi:hypothetical protein